nr:hypothetical protein [Psychrobacter sp. PraFG1]UNK06016.1 hypothetical protein MN210_04790 [Psychrobacter sp. PraFG1]
MLLSWLYCTLFLRIGISISSLDEEDGFLIAKLADDYSRVAYYISQTPSTYNVSIQAVQGFYVLTQRALNLLENEILHSRSVVEYDANIESLWTKWVSSQIEIRHHDKGNKFLEILGYSKFQNIPSLTSLNIFNNLPNRINQKYLSKEQQDILRKIKDFGKEISFAWLFVSFIFSLNHEKIYQSYQTVRNSEISELKEAYDSIKKLI